MVQGEGGRNTGGGNKRDERGFDPTQQMEVVILLCFNFRPTMHAFRPRSQQAGA